MRQPYQAESPDAATCREANISALINELDRRVRNLESDIASEEARAGVSNPFNAAYPVLARMMTARRDNLRQTIAALELRRPPESVVLAG